MTHHLFGAKPKPMLSYCLLDHLEYISVKFNFKLFINENAFENVVCKVAAILAWPQFDLLLFWCCVILSDQMEQIQVMAEGKPLNDRKSPVAPFTNMV